MQYESNLFRKETEGIRPWRYAGVRLPGSCFNITNTDKTEDKPIKGLPSEDCVLSVQVGARPEGDEAGRKTTSIQTSAVTSRVLETHMISKLL